MGIFSVFVGGRNKKNDRGEKRGKEERKEGERRRERLGYWHGFFLVLAAVRGAPSKKMCHASGLRKAFQKAALQFPCVSVPT